MARRLSFFLFVSLLVVANAVPLAAGGERTVDLTAADGTKLKATYFPADHSSADHSSGNQSSGDQSSGDHAGPGVLLLHQCNRQRKVWDGLARQLAAAGINVLTFDQRGFGESGGDPFDKLTPQQRQQIETEKRPHDIDTAFQYLVSQPGVNRDLIGLGGASCGVNFSIQTALLHPEVKSLVLLSGNTNLAGRQFLRKAATLPVFFSVADDDEFPPSVAAIEWLYTLAADPEKKFVHYTNGGHGADMFPVHPELPGVIVDWFVTTLIKTPGRAPVPKEAPAIPQEVNILEMLDQPGGAAKVEQKLNQARQRDPKATLVNEALVNVLGYEHLLAGDNKGAVEIMKLNVVAYPNSPNGYDSLSDAYVAEGDQDLARQSCKKALELLSTDTTDPEERKKLIRDSAAQKLKQLGDKTQSGLAPLRSPRPTCVPT